MYPPIYSVIGRKNGVPHTVTLSREVTHEIALAVVERESRPRMVKARGKAYNRFYDWQWLSVVRSHGSRN
jgi:hypothetical protein